jgi:hypothetical protein
MPSPQQFLHRRLDLLVAALAAEDDQEVVAAG